VCRRLAGHLPVCSCCRNSCVRRPEGLVGAFESLLLVPPPGAQHRDRNARSLAGRANGSRVQTGEELAQLRGGRSGTRAIPGAHVRHLCGRVERASRAHVTLNGCQAALLLHRDRPGGLRLRTRRVLRRRQSHRHRRVARGDGDSVLSVRSALCGVLCARGRRERTQVWLAGRTSGPRSSADPLCSNAANCSPSSTRIGLELRPFPFRRARRVMYSANHSPKEMHFSRLRGQTSFWFTRIDISGDSINMSFSWFSEYLVPRIRFKYT